jgi:A118 family predicted phage portal protein
VFSEYAVSADQPLTRQLMASLSLMKERAMALALVGGECYLKPWPEAAGFGFTLIPRDRILIFGRDAHGQPTDVGTVEQSVLGSAYYTLLERRRLDEKGCLIIENRLYRSFTEGMLGEEVPLTGHPMYAQLPERFTYEGIPGLGLVRMKNPMLGCVDGSADGVSVYAAAVGLIHAIDQNEYQLSGEFSRGESRVFVSADLLDGGKLQDNLFVGLEEDPQNLGITLFSPQLREQSFLRRKQEYLRNVESLVGIKRGLLCDANLDQRTATEISASETEHALTVLDFQNMWQQAVEETLTLCAALAKVYGVAGVIQPVRIEWGNGVLFDEEKRWADYKEMVSMGLIRPEVALGWRFGLPTETEADLAAIRKKFMPNERQNAK